MKKINWAYIHQELEFDSEREFEVYISNLRGRFVIDEKETLPGGRVKIIIKKHYNNCNMKGDADGT